MISAVELGQYYKWRKKALQLAEEGLSIPSGKTAKLFQTVVRAVMLIMLIIYAVMSLGVILSLLFKLVKVSAFEMISLSENGFGFLDYDSEFVEYPFKWQNTFFGIIMWFILILGAILFVCCLYKLFSVLTNEKSKFMKKETTFVGTFSFVLTAIYGVSGILFSLIFKSINYSEINYTEGLSISTFCYIPIIILSILYITYVFIYFSGTKEEKINNNHKNTNYYDKRQSNLRFNRKRKTTPN